MAIVVQIGKRKALPRLCAVDRNVFCFQFFGEEYYTDPADLSTWRWVGNDNGVLDSILVYSGTTKLNKVYSYEDCVADDASFYWDNTNGTLYVHWPLGVWDWFTSRETSSFAVLDAGYCDKYLPKSGNVFNGLFYKPDLVNLGAMVRKVDPLKLGLLEFTETSFTIQDVDGEFAGDAPKLSVGAPAIAYMIDDDETVLDDTKLFFSGTTKGLSHSREQCTFKITENRSWTDVPACPNVLTIEDFPDCDSKEGAKKPVAFGDIAFGPMVLTNKAALTTDDAGTAVFLVSDPAFGVIGSITGVKDIYGTAQTITASSTTTCLVSVTKPAGVKISEVEKWTWSGTGYAGPTIYNNPLDIITWVLDTYVLVPYTASNYDTTVWDVARVTNNKPVGFCVNSDRGITEEIIQALCVSLQGFFFIRGDGRITWKGRDTTAAPVDMINIWDQSDIPDVANDDTELVSTVNVQYNPFGLLTGYSETIYKVSQNYVIANYGYDRNTPISPYKTHLTQLSDVLTVLEDIFGTSADPQRIVKVSCNRCNPDILPLDIVAIDTGEYGAPVWEYGEVLQFAPDYVGDKMTLTVRIVRNYVLP